MSQVTKEINKVTSTIIGISGKLIIYAVVLLLLVEGMTRGYAFGYSIFHSQPMEEAPGTEKTVTITEGQSASDAAKLLKDLGLVSNDLAVLIQMKFYDYDIYPGTYTLNTAMTSKEILQALNEKPAEEETSGREEASGQEETFDQEEISGQEETLGEEELSGQNESSGQGETAEPEENGTASEENGAGQEDEPEVEIRINAAETGGRQI